MIFVYILLVLQTEVATIFKTPLSPRNANYTIRAELFPDEKQVKGVQTLTWTNISGIATNELQFHLYLNAFSHEKTTFMMESGGRHRGNAFSKIKAGYCKIESFNIGGVEYTPQFIRPDDGNIHDSTVVKINLSEDVLPNQTLEINISFTSKLPQVFARTGFSDPEYTENYFLVAQWFPKIGVLEENGWNCHQFHANTEFFSDYGVYHVELTVPKNYVVGATGIQRELKSTKTHTTHTFLAEDVHDFAWTAYPGFKVYQELYKSISIRFLYLPEQEKEREAQVQSLRYAIDLFQDYFGAYPYPSITFLNPPEGAMASAGMEYPMFFTAGLFKEAPKGVRFRHELVTIHEFGHQFFYGIIGTNEFEHSWMDEGITSYGQQRTIDTYYNGIIHTPFLKLRNEDMDRFAYLSSPNKESLLKTSYLQNPRNYQVNSYPRPAILLRTLEKYLGTELFKQGMKHYYETWKFKHPKPEDFFTAMSEGTNQNLNWFFTPFFKENKTVDYELVSIRSQKITSAFSSQIRHFPNTDISHKDSLYLNTIEIRNNGTASFPVTLQITLSDYSVWNNAEWNRDTSYETLQFYSNAPLQTAEIDPERILAIDLSYTNNGKSVETNDIALKFTSRWRYWSHSLLQLFSGF